MNRSTQSPFYLLLLGLLLISLGACNNQEAAMGQLQVKLDSLEQEAQSLRKENALLLETVGERLEVGFEVQIGAFQYFDLNAYDSELLRLQEIKEEGMNKYVLGRFRRFEEAEAFLTDIRSLGLEDAFIAGIVDGQRATVAAAKKAASSYY
ncbi:MAG: hypothetical protein AAFQ87_08625, partial [Bacteroidota bacterium]